MVFETFNTSLGSIATALIVWYGGGQVVQNEISLGSMVLFTQLIGMMVTPVIAVGQQFNSLFRSMASGERIFQALDWKEKLHEPEHPVTLPERLEGEVELRDVNFSYTAGGPVLKDVSFKIAPGEKLAIVGPTGSRQEHRHSAARPLLRHRRRHDLHRRHRRQRHPQPRPTQASGRRAAGLSRLLRLGARQHHSEQPRDQP